MDTSSGAMVSPSSGNGATGEGMVLPFRRPKKKPIAHERLLDAEAEDESYSDSVEILEGKIAGFAAKGLAEVEIRHLLAEALMEHPIEEDRFAAAMEKGRGMGRARIKSAQYDAALAGKVSAQAQVLARLENQEGQTKGGVREFEVVREIVPARKPEN